MLVVKLLLYLYNGTPPPIDMLKYKYGGGNSTRSRLEILLEKMIMFECKGYNERQYIDEHFEYLYGIDLSDMLKFTVVEVDDQAHCTCVN